MATHARQQYFADENSLSKERREFSIADEIQEKIDSVEEGAQVNKIETVKVNGTALVPDANKAVNVDVPEVIDNLYTVATDDALSAKQGKLLYDYIQNLQAIGRFLSNWDSATGLPITNPSESPYLYKAGDYYRVSNVAVSPALNYKPDGSSFIIGQASTTVETNNINISDLYLYDGTTWILLSNSGSSIAVDSSLSTTSTNPVENRVITNALNGKHPGEISNVTPSNPVEGMLWYDTVNDELKVYNGTQWKNVDTDTQNNWIDVEVTTAYNTAAKIGTTTAGDYTPTKGDFLLVEFTRGSNVANPTLNIDGSGAKNIKSGNANVDVNNFNIGTSGSTKILMYYDGDYYKVWSTANTTYGLMGVAEGQAGTATYSRVVRADYLKQIIEYHAGNLHDDTKQDKLIAGSNIQIASDGKTISATDTIYTAGDGINIDANNVISNTLPGATVSATAPSSPSEGDLWYDTANDALKAYDGTNWNIEGTRMTILKYGISTWNDFITAYNDNAIVYCRASSQSNPATGTQTRLAFMAYVNNETTPTEVEFQYYRSVSTHSDSQQGDQVFVYKLTNASGGTWTVTTREASSKIATSTGLTSSYSNGTLTLSNTGVTSFNGNSGAVTYTAPVTSVNGSTGAVTVTEFTPGGTATTGYVVTKTAGGYEWAAPTEPTVVSDDSGVTYHITVSNSDPTSGTASNIITLVP